MGVGWGGVGERRELEQELMMQESNNELLGRGSGRMARGLSPGRMRSKLIDLKVGDMKCLRRLYGHPEK